MAARPRSHNISIPNLYCKLDKRTGKVYWQYKHPFTGRFHSLGTNEDEAKQIASDANSIIAEQKTRQILSINDRLTRVKNSSCSPSATQWIERYIEIQKERVAHHELKESSLKQKMKPLKLFNEHCGMTPMDQITTLHISEIINQVKAKGHNRMAQVVRLVLIDVFKDAQHAGVVPPGYNPALATRQPRNKVTRHRLSFEEWQVIFEQTKTMRPYLANGMLLALVTGQRIGDICKMKFTDIWDDHLHIEQEKTGSRLAIPLALKCNALEMTLADVVSMCRDAVVSKYLLHHRCATSLSPRGGQLSTHNLTTAFKKARDKSGLTWPEKSAPSFHEQRSLSERIFRQQGIDTQKLLGHKSSKMTEKYNDDRGKDWVTISLKSG